MKLFPFVILFFACSFLLTAQMPQRPVKADEQKETEEPKKPDQPRKPAQTRRIDLVNANSMEFDRSIGEDVRRVIGNVIFKHEDAIMHCDSAYLYSQENRLDAFSNIHIQIGDTIDIFGDILYYEGNTSIAEIHHNVRMQDENMVLTTEHLFYDLKANTATYDDGGRIIDKDNVLTSIFGFYYADLKHFFFKEDVVLVNPEYTMYSDTLKYNTQTETSYFFGPTTIVSDENTIFCKNGWYDTKNDIAQFNKEAYIVNKEHSITGDSLFYDRTRGYGKAIMNVEIKDTIQNTIINGNFAEHFENEGLSVVTQNAMLTVMHSNDSLFLHADTLKYTFKDEPLDKEKKLSSVENQAQNNDFSLNEPDEPEAEKPDNEVNKIRKLHAYNRAKFYRTDFQGVSDSILYSFSDSIIYMYNNPILWTEEHQLTANIIEINTWDEVLNKANLTDAAFIISQEDTENFNQIKGRKITGYFKNNHLYKVDVFGNGETVYYIRDDYEDLVGINKAISANMTIYIEDNQVTQIVFFDDPEANLFPPRDLPPEERLLRNFKWHIDLRPKSKEDIFIWR